MAAAPPLKAAARRKMKQLLLELLEDSKALNESLEDVTRNHKEDLLLRLCYTASESMEGKINQALRLINPNKPEKMMEHRTIREVEKRLEEIVQTEDREAAFRDLIILKERLTAKVYKENEEK